MNRLLHLTKHVQDVAPSHAADEAGFSRRSTLANGDVSADVLGEAGANASRGRRRSGGDCKAVAGPPAPRPETAHYDYRSVDPCPGSPRGFHLRSDLTLDEARHLQIELPTHGYDESFVRVPFAEAVRDGRPLVATEPFRIFSDEGLRIARGEFARNVQHVREICRSTSLRHLGFRSSFYRGFATAPELLKFLSGAAGEAIAAHPHSSNISQVNVGQPGGGAPEMWHQDSVDYVLLTMLGDTTDMQGGELLIYMDEPQADSLDKLAAGAVPREKIVRIPSPPAGYGVFLRGSKLFHNVTGLMQARENRMSIVNSYQRLDVFAPDATRLHSQAAVFGDGHTLANVEFARHRAHRAAGQLEHFLGDIAHWGRDAATLASFLKRAGDELTTAADILRGKVCDMRAEAVGANQAQAEVASSQDVVAATGAKKPPRRTDAPDRRASM
jgi:hypothetical protein